MKIAGASVGRGSVFVGTAAHAEDLAVKIGVMSDMSGLYADLGGPGSVAAAKLAIEGLQSGGARHEGRDGDGRHAK